MVAHSSSVSVRDVLGHVLREDLVGPDEDSPNARETLSAAPSRWYLTGFLVPYEADESQRTDPTAQESLDLDGDAGGTDDNDTPEKVSGRRAFFPSSLGVSVLVPSDADVLQVTVTWGDYTALEAPEDPSDEAPAEKPETPRIERWARTPRRATVTVPIRGAKKRAAPLDVPGSAGLRVVASARVVSRRNHLVPRGTRSVSVFLVNHREPAADARKDESFAFQAALSLRCDAGFVARPDLRGRDTHEWDDRVAELQYRDAVEYAVGHGVATTAAVDPDGRCRAVATTWIPCAEVEKVVPGTVKGVSLSMDALAACASPDELRARVGALVTEYAAWIAAQRATPLAEEHRREVAEQLLDRAEFARGRIADGLACLDDPRAFEAFRITNRAMATAARQRSPDLYSKGAAPTWRPFQLAFLLMNLRGVETPTHPDRELVDLLFFPTGGGKTEAYLGLAAFTLVLRRLRNPGLASAGVSVLMRYTLRLLTLDQLGRAATLICALELERQNDIEKLGPWPFEIGLWVGQAATPNRMGQKGDGNAHTARARTIAYKNDDRKPSPIPIETCPWCGEKFTRNSFSLVPHPDHPTDLRVLCTSRKPCAFKGTTPLPIVAVDEPIYRRLPCFLIATVDKFANLPWVGETGALLGRVDRYDKGGFYGPCDPGVGHALPAPLLPPDVIIQDELHLISGPLGTMVGLYETALDTLCERTSPPNPLSTDGEGASEPLIPPSPAPPSPFMERGAGGVRSPVIRPKIVASTATVRRAEAQIRALFGRRGVEVFPPPGPDRRDSFFAETVPSTVKNARRYLGVAAQGRSLKVVLLRTYLALLAAGQRFYADAGGDSVPNNPVDPYMTLLGYFNSLRELGGSRRIVEDEVRARLEGFDRRVRHGERSGPFARRTIAYEVVELTSRESTAKVADTKRRLALAFRDKERVDVALATNMISVGLDITRLGLMVVLGQPKSTAEYIQATSRVGRDDERPGLVVTLLNIHRPRDRSHYERFEAYHQSFYRAVEATSVTPFSPRAIDRGIAAVTVALARLGEPSLTPAMQAVAMPTARRGLAFVAEALAKRAEASSDDAHEATALSAKLRATVKDLLDAWEKLAHRQASVGAKLQYQRETPGAPPLLYDPLDPELAKQPPDARKFKARRSLRDVEPSVNLWVHRLDGIEVPSEEEASP